MKRTMLQKFGILGLISLLSYTAAVVFAPLAYPGYNWLAQAVSDLSADSAPSRTLWNQLSALYMPCGIVCCTMCAIEISTSPNRARRTGVYLFAAMNWLSAVGYAMFPLPEAGTPGGFQGTMHMGVTAFVVLLSIASLILMICGDRGAHSGLGAWAAAALAMMLLGAIGTGIVPGEYFGIPERFSVFAATGFNAVLGMYLFYGRLGEGRTSEKHDRDIR